MQHRQHNTKRDKINNLESQVHKNNTHPRSLKKLTEKANTHTPPYNNKANTKLRTCKNLQHRTNIGHSKHKHTQHTQSTATKKQDPQKTRRNKNKLK